MTKEDVPSRRQEMRQFRLQNLHFILQTFLRQRVKFALLERLC